MSTGQTGQVTGQLSGAHEARLSSSANRWIPSSDFTRVNSSVLRLTVFSTLSTLASSSSASSPMVFGAPERSESRMRCQLAGSPPAPRRRDVDPM